MYSVNELFNTALLHPKLEVELQNIYKNVDYNLQCSLIKAWKNVKSQNAKIKEIEAYKFIDILMKDNEGKEKIKNSKFYQVLYKAFEKVGKEKEFEEAFLNS